LIDEALMEFDTTIQGRWKVSFGFFVFGMIVFGLLRLTPFAWYRVDWLFGAVVCSFGAFFAVLSIAAGERRADMAWIALAANLWLPTIVIISVFSSG
jgi:hypothetical protein